MASILKRATYSRKLKTEQLFICIKTVKGLVVILSVNYVFVK